MKEQLCSNCRKHKVIDERIYCTYHRAFIDRDANKIAEDCKNYEI